MPIPFVLPLPALVLPLMLRQTASSMEDAFPASTRIYLARGLVRSDLGGAEVRQPLQDAFWGERYGQITDPFGHRWGLAQQLRNVPRQEIGVATRAPRSP